MAEQQLARHAAHHQQPAAAAQCYCLDREPATEQLSAFSHNLTVSRDCIEVCSDIPGVVGEGVEAAHPSEGRPVPPARVAVRVAAAVLRGEVPRCVQHGDQGQGAALGQPQLDLAVVLEKVPSEGS